MSITVVGVLVAIVTSIILTVCAVYATFIAPLKKQVKTLQLEANLHKASLDELHARMNRQERMSAKP